MPAVVLCLLVTPLGVHAQQRPTEYQIKAAYLYNFARFVTWPTGAAALGPDPVTMCVLGDDPFGPVLDAAGTGLLVSGKRTVVRRITNVSDTGTCGVLFISESGGPALENVIATVGTRGVLTVSDLPDFTRRGGIIQFVISGNRIRFEVNLAAADTAGLTLSSELLKVAVTVRRTPRSGS